MPNHAYPNHLEKGLALKIKFKIKIISRTCGHHGFFVFQRAGSAVIALHHHLSVVATACRGGALGELSMAHEHMLAEVAAVALFSGFCGGSGG